ncbi:hypothetical protein Salat_2114300 [Sesamum alatum]|uniref:Uncharacterized protein n=1 Tax=Sesamum alatum TaxID=300844 RepID=A0AAE2CGX0_9LAMI|nr:hypothetical protein Salat_2114300 [Sesamum alatum]
MWHGSGLARQLRGLAEGAGIEVGRWEICLLGHYLQLSSRRETRENRSRHLEENLRLISTGQCINNVMELGWEHLRGMRRDGASGGKLSFFEESTMRNKRNPFLPDLHHWRRLWDI